MGIFSRFFRQKAQEVPKSNNDKYFSKVLYENIVNSSDLMMLYFTKKDGWIGANKTYFDISGVKNIEEFKERYDGIKDIFSSESEDIFIDDDKTWLEYVMSHEEGYRLTLLNKNKKLLNILAKCKLISNTQNIYVLELQDITQLHLANQKATDVEQLKSKFLSNIGHEFRTPMNGILGFIELISQTTLSKKQAEYIELINRSSRNLMANIETLLDLSQMQGGRLKLNNSPFAILSEMEEVAYNYYIQARGKNISVLTFIDPKLPQELIGDIKKIKQVMHSLVQNAIKFTPSGGKVIMEVKLLKRQQNGDCSIGFSVKDNGQGIPKEQIASILEPFSAGNQADERLGVGLSLSNGLVQLFGSELKIQSEADVGSHFNFTIQFKASKGQAYKMLPKKKVKVLLLEKSRIDEANFLTIYLRSFAMDVIKSNVINERIFDGIDALYVVANQQDLSWIRELATYSKKVPVILLVQEREKLETKATHIVDSIIKTPLLASHVSTQLHQLFDIKIAKNVKQQFKIRKNISALIAEDNLINQKLVQILLKDYNINVFSALDGVEAVNMCYKYKYDIILMDIDMPNKNGIQATKEIKVSDNINFNTPIVALTAMAMDGDKEMLLEAGLDDYISKPLTREKLENILIKYLKIPIT